MKPWLADALLVPWRATGAAQRGSALAMWALFTLGALGVLILIMLAPEPEPGLWLVCAAVYAFGVFILWALWLSASVLPAIDARRLRLPRMQRAATRGVACYALLTVGLPVLALTLLGADAWTSLMVIALAAAAGIALMLLPGYIAAAACFVPLFGAMARPWLGQPPSPGADWPAMACLLGLLPGISAWCWWHLLRTGGKASIYGSALVMLARPRGAAPAEIGIMPLNSGATIGRHPGWRQPPAAAGQPSRDTRRFALRIALGGSYLPMPAAQQWRILLASLLALALFVLALAYFVADQLQSLPPQLARQSIALGVAALLGPVCALITLITTVAHLRQRWQRANAELPLLALLPGMGDAQQLKHNLLRVSIATPAASLAAFLVGSLGIALALRAHATALLWLALPIGGALLAVIAQTLCIYGNRRLPRWVERLWYLALGLLFACCALAPFARIAPNPALDIAALESCLLAAWGAMVLALLWQGRRGWHAFRRRPHPFLLTP